MRDRSQSSFSVSYKNMKKSPSLQSLDNISIDSYLMEDGDMYSLLERGVAITPAYIKIETLIIYFLSFISCLRPHVLDETKENYDCRTSTCSRLL